MTKTSQRSTEAIHSGLALVRESATSLALGRDSRQAEEWGSFIGVGVGVGGVLELCPDWRLLAWGRWRWVTEKLASYVVDLRSIFGFFQVSPGQKGDRDLELEAKWLDFFS